MNVHQIQQILTYVPVFALSIVVIRFVLVIPLEIIKEKITENEIKHAGSYKNYMHRKFNPED